MSRATSDEKAYMGRVAALCCVLCRHLGIADDSPAVVHHLRTGQGKKRASHKDTMPLCPLHHQFSGFGVHDMGRPQFEARYGISEVGLLEMTKQLLGEA